MILKQELTKEQLQLLMSMDAIFINDEPEYAYYRLPWARVQMGSSEVEFMPHESNYPEDLRKALGMDLEELKDLYEKDGV